METIIPIFLSMPRLTDCPIILECPRMRPCACCAGCRKAGCRLSLGWWVLPVRAPKGFHATQPVVIANYSLHGMLLSPGAKDCLRGTDPELVERHADPQWCERTLAAVLSLYGRFAKLTTEKLRVYMDRLAALGVGLAEDMAILDEQALTVIRDSSWGSRLPLLGIPGSSKPSARGASKPWSDSSFSWMAPWPCARPHSPRHICRAEPASCSILMMTCMRG